MSSSGAMAGDRKVCSGEEAGSLFLSTALFLAGAHTPEQLGRAVTLGDTLLRCRDQLQKYSPLLEGELGEDEALLKDKFVAVLRISHHSLMRQQPLSPRRWEWRRRKEVRYCWCTASSRRSGLGLPGSSCLHTVPQSPPPVKLLRSELPS